MCTEGEGLDGDGLACEVGVLEEKNAADDGVEQWCRAMEHRKSAMHCAWCTFSYGGLHPDSVTSHLKST